jgi:hypothetical protein
MRGLSQLAGLTEARRGQSPPMPVASPSRRGGADSEAAMPRSRAWPHRHHVALGGPPAGFRVGPALLARRPTKVAAIALANKIARMVWAMMARGERYKEPFALAR